MTPGTPTISQPPRRLSRWPRVVAVLATLIANGARAEEEPPTRSEIDGQIAWARATWRDDLKGAHFHSPLAHLLAWVPRSGAIPVYVYTDDFACRRATLARDDPAADDTQAEGKSPTLTATISGRALQEAGQQFREVTFIAVGNQLSREDGVTMTEALDASGRWQLESSSGFGLDPIVYGALSYADDRVARWDGRPLSISPYCAGPVEWLACPAGGEHPCERCDEVSLVTDPGSLSGHSRNYGPKVIGCHDRCPPYPESPDIARLQQLQAYVPIWRPRKALLATVPSLYKSRTDCRREHPQVAAVPSSSAHAPGEHPPRDAKAPKTNP